MVPCSARGARDGDRADRGRNRGDVMTLEEDDKGVSSARERVESTEVQFGKRDESERALALREVSATSYDTSSLGALRVERRQMPSIVIRKILRG